MSTSIEGFYSPASGTEAPLEMLGACHTRVIRQCQTLERLVPHLSRHGADEQAKTAASAVMRYFDTAAVHHHEDEEVDLFPALIESMAGSDAVCIHEMTAALVAEHRVLEAQWRTLRLALDAIVNAPEVNTHEAGLDPARVTGFVRDYKAHITREDDELLPMAARLLDASAIERIGRAMRERRGITAV